MQRHRDERRRIGGWQRVSSGSSSCPRLVVVVRPRGAKDRSHWSDTHVLTRTGHSHALTVPGTWHPPFHDLCLRTVSRAVSRILPSVAHFPFPWQDFGAGSARNRKATRFPVLLSSSCDSTTNNDNREYVSSNNKERITDDEYGIINK